MTEQEKRAKADTLVQAGMAHGMEAHADSLGMDPECETCVRMVTEVWETMEWDATDDLQRTDCPEELKAVLRKMLERKAEKVH